MRASTTNLFNIKNLGLAVLSIILSVVLVTSWLATAVNASGIMSVTSNVADVAAGNSDNFVVTVNIQNDGDVAELEVDNSLEPSIPQLSVYANAADPYNGTGETGQEAIFNGAGASVEYNGSRWVIDLGDSLTADILNSGNDTFTMYLVLKDASGNVLWGDMNNVSQMPVFNFNFATGVQDVTEGTTYSLVSEDQPAEDEAVVPGVPNTSLGQ